MEHSQPTPIATWNPARDVWETQTTGMFCEHSDVFSETWPSSGMTRRGRAYALPTSAPHTGGSGYSSSPGLLLTPRVSDGNGARPPLLPTPAVNDMGRAYTPDTWDEWTARMKAAHGNGNGHGPSPHVESLRMLPTPTAADSKGSGGKVGSSDVTLTDATERADLRGIEWGAYAPAITRWEAVLGRPAPAPTEPTGEGGAHRLSPDFVEWMMGLPAGWTKVPGVTRNHRLKTLGNGVVPQQATEAVRRLLAIREIEVAA